MGELSLNPPPKDEVCCFSVACSHQAGRLGFGAWFIWTTILKAGGWNVLSIFIFVYGQRFKEFSMFSRPTLVKFGGKKKKIKQSRYGDVSRKLQWRRTVDDITAFYRL